MNYWDHHISDHWNYIRSYGEGENSPNRKKLFQYIPEGSSMLDIGSGPGCNLSHIKDNNLNIKYKGVDYCEGFINTCKEHFGSDANFELQDAMDIREADSSFDVVVLQDVLEHLPSYEEAITHAVRVARNRVIICMWNPLLEDDKEDTTQDKGDLGYHSFYNGKKFIEFINQFGTVTYDEEHQNRNHWYYIIDLYKTNHKRYPKALIDFDDFSEGSNRLDLLFQLKSHFPNFKVTMFSPYKRSSIEFLNLVKDLNWIELAMHGYDHATLECKDWTYDEAIVKIQEQLNSGYYVKGFKAPYWHMNPEVYRACKDLGVWIADNIDRSGNNYAEIPMDQQTFVINGGPWLSWMNQNKMKSIHGHISWVKGLNNEIDNILQEIYDLFAKETEFYFMSEAVDWYYTEHPIISTSINNEALQAV